MDFIPEALEEYASNHSEAEPEVLKALSRETWQKVLAPRMLSGHLQGRLLSMISNMLQPKSILEIGTYTGYSAICLAEGLHPDGELHTIDINEELYDIQRKYFDLSGYGDKIFQHVGDARTIIPEINKEFDLVFIDADKKNYPTYLEILLPILKEGAVILSDNVLWSGKVLEPVAEDDEDTEALIRYNKMLSDHPKLKTVLLPVRDGLTITRVR